jgi:hypothetical protein
MATEKASTQQSGWTMLFFNILFTFVIIGIIIFAAVNDIPLLMIPVAIFFILNIIIFVGFFTIEPNEAMVLLLFGRYVGN